MIRLATYSIAALIVVFLMSSSADGGMIYASDFGEGRFAVTSRAELGIPTLEENIGAQTWESKSVETLVADRVPLMNWEPITRLSFSELEKPPTLSTADVWDSTDDSPAVFPSILGGSNMNSDELSWQPLVLPHDTSPHEFPSIWTNVAAENPACSLVSGVLSHDGIGTEQFWGAPCNGFQYDTLSVGPVLQASDRTVPFNKSSFPWEKDSPNRVPADSLPQDAILAPFGSEIVSRTLKSNDGARKSNTGNQQRGWPRLDPS